VSPSLVLFLPQKPANPESFVNSLFPFIFSLLSFIFSLFSFLFYLLSFLFYLLSFIFYLLSFLFYLLSFLFYLFPYFYPMNWNKLINTARLGSKNRKVISPEMVRSEFQRDYDRLIFSSAFRRLQNKTQVFPLPGSVFVHNRLTHSLEVASIGKSLGEMLSVRLKSDKYLSFPGIDELGTIVSAACLAHDLGNPPFGHSGELAISKYFIDGEGKHFKDKVKDEEWSDLLHFEGNANAFRLLTHQFNGKRKGGFALTFSVLAALVKYPFPSTAFPEKKKYGFFKSDSESYKYIARQLGIKELDNRMEQFARHPLVFLVEAADDIAYQLMDLEDAMKLRILNAEEVEYLFLNFFDKDKDKKFFSMKKSVYDEIVDTNERIAFLRANVIGKLLNESIDVFMHFYDKILSGSFQMSLIKYLPERSRKAMKKVSIISLERIYRHPDVVSIELSGYNILGFLLHEFTTAVFNPDSDYSTKILSLMPQQYLSYLDSEYSRLQSVLDFISGMTDLYALKLYKDIRGLSLV
jgi:dGTPase